MPSWSQIRMRASGGANRQSPAAGVLIVAIEYASASNQVMPSVRLTSRLFARRRGQHERIVRRSANTVTSVPCRRRSRTSRQRDAAQGRYQILLHRCDSVGARNMALRSRAIRLRNSRSAFSGQHQTIDTNTARSQPGTSSSVIARRRIVACRVVSHVDLSIADENDVALIPDDGSVMSQAAFLNASLRLRAGAALPICVRAARGASPRIVDSAGNHYGGHPPNVQTRRDCRAVDHRGR